MRYRYCRLTVLLKQNNGTELTSKAMDLWAYSNCVHLDFIRPGRPVENGYIESFNGKLRDECLNVEVFFTLADARHKLEHWHHDYNHQRPHSALNDRTPAEFAITCSGGQDGGRAALENASRFPLSLRTTTALTTSLLETLTWSYSIPSNGPKPNQAGRNLRSPLVQFSGASHRYDFAAQLGLSSRCEPAEVYNGIVETFAED